MVAMNFSFKTLKSRIKDRLWIWQPILFFTIVTVVAFMIIYDYNYNKDQLSLLRSKKPITKVEIKIGSDSPTTFVTITDRLQLDSINAAFQTALEKDIPQGGAFKTLSRWTIYKRGEEMELSVNHSIYNGWMINAAGTSFTSEYLFSLVKRYAKNQ